LRELARLGTLSAVAETYFLSVSAVSQQLSTLEREIGVALVRRNGRRLSLTEAGELLVKHAEGILRDVERAEAEIGALQSELRGRLQVAAFPGAARTIAVQALANCRREYPDLRMGFEELETHEAIDALHRGDVDAAVVYEYNALAPLDSAGLDLVLLFSEPLLVVLPSGSMSDSNPISPSTLKDHFWVSPRPETLCHEALKAICTGVGFRPRIEFTTNDYGLAITIVEAGLAACLVPATALIEVSPVRRVYLASRNGVNHRPAMGLLLDAFRVRASQLAALVSSVEVPL
jgi:DNA-binding transcriptional LysR family regulator